MSENLYFCTMLRKKSYNIKSLIRKGLAVAAGMAALYSCASIGRPDGGPLDETPPRFIKSSPVAGALNNTKKKVSLEFDEYIKLEKANEKVVISPPQVQQPEIKPSGKKININLLDSLKPNTTYTIDFSDAIVDNNEGNPLGNFAFTFSTGDVIDTLEVSGTLLEASNLEPVKGMLVGLHSNLSDTAFTKLPFDRVARTDSRGRFVIRGIAPGEYRIYGLMDADQNFAFSQKSEALAFNDSLVIPRWEERLRQDTSWVDSLTIDTIVETKYTYYLPDNIILRSFLEELASQYLIKSERLTPEKFTFYFAAKADTLPVLKGLNFDERDAFIIEKNLRNDTIHYWIKDSLLYKQDTLSLSLNYLYTDTLNRLIPRTDTLNLVAKSKYLKNDIPQDESKKKKKKKDDEEEPEPTKFLPVAVRASSSMDVYDYVSLTFEEPIAWFDSAAIHLKQKVDTLWKDVPFVFEQDSLNLRRYNLFYDWEPALEYEFSVDSTAFHGIYGLFTDKIKQNLKIRSLEEYGAIYFNVTGCDSIAYVELLDAQDKVVRKVPVIDGKADFYFLNPGKYCARLVNDTNGNGVWDTGEYETKRQPEMVYYYPQILEPRANWEVEQSWNVLETPMDKQKPDELKKQKPDEDKKNRNNSRSSRRN